MEAAREARIQECPAAARIENKIALSYTFAGVRIIRLEVLGAGSSYHEALEKAGMERI